MISSEDFFQNYRGAFMRITIPKFDEAIIARLDSVETDKPFQRLVFSTEHLGEIRIHLNGKIKMNVDNPTTGFFNFNNTVLQFMRLTPRQRIRGFTPSNIVFTDPVKLLINKLQDKSSVVEQLMSFPTVEAAFRGNFPSSLLHAMQILQKERRFGIALDRKFWLAQPLQPKQGFALMTFDLCNVGFIDSNLSLTIREPYQQEIQLWFDSYQRDDRTNRLGTPF